MFKIFEELFGDFDKDYISKTQIYASQLVYGAISNLGIHLYNDIIDYTKGEIECLHVTVEPYLTMLDIAREIYKDVK